MEETAKSRFWTVAFLCCSLWIVLLIFHFSFFGINDFQDQIHTLGELMQKPRNTSDSASQEKSSNHSDSTFQQVSGSRDYSEFQQNSSNHSAYGAEPDPCLGRYVYVHDLPPRFNDDILEQFCKPGVWIPTCNSFQNAGFGPPMEGEPFSGKSWFDTNQFSLDLLFRQRMEQYQCRTRNSSEAAAIFVPYYAGLDIFLHLWDSITVRDSAPLALMDWLQRRREWRINNGRDHFMVGGRITWAFRRQTDQNSDWGTKLLMLPAMKNMTMLMLESAPWKRNEIAVPYPTYFHPATDTDVKQWQDTISRLGRSSRPYLFSFAGAPRGNGSIRNRIMEQCRVSRDAKLLDCGQDKSGCGNPNTVMKMFMESVFCLQPAGDSPTRRSFFDSILAGCIPVLFHPDSAYTQYLWYLPRDFLAYSVFIPEIDILAKNVSIEQKLQEIQPQKVDDMRQQLIRLIPAVVYAQKKLGGFKDAFDIALESIIGEIREQILDGHVKGDYSSEEMAEFFSWPPKFEVREQQPRSEDSESQGPPSGQASSVSDLREGNRSSNHS